MKRGQGKADCKADWQLGYDIKPSIWTWTWTWTWTWATLSMSSDALRSAFYPRRHAGKRRESLELAGRCFGCFVQRRVSKIPFARCPALTSTASLGLPLFAPQLYPDPNLSIVLTISIARRRDITSVITFFHSPSLVVSF